MDGMHDREEWQVAELLRDAHHQVAVALPSRRSLIAQVDHRSTVVTVASQQSAHDAVRR
jgi:hypothetical protein